LYIPYLVLCIISTFLHWIHCCWLIFMKFWVCVPGYNMLINYLYLFQCRNCDYQQVADNPCIYVNKITHAPFVRGIYTVLEMKIWIYWSESNLFFIIVLNKNFKITLNYPIRYSIYIYWLLDSLLLINIYEILSLCTRVQYVNKLFVFISVP
jgi:hypothetical protein